MFLRHFSPYQDLFNVTNAARLLRLLTPEVKVFVRPNRPLAELSADSRHLLSSLACPPHSGVALRVGGELGEGRGGQSRCKQRLHPGDGCDLGQELAALLLLAVAQGARLLEGFHPAGGAFNVAPLPLLVQNLIQHWKIQDGRVNPFPTPAL